MKKVQQKPPGSSQAFFQRMVLALFHFLVLAVPLFFTFNTSELFEFNKMVLTYALSILIAAFWVGRMLVTAKIIFKRTFLDTPIVLFLVSQILSVVFSIHPYTSLLGYYSRFHGGLLSTITYIVLYYAFVSNVEKKHLPAFFISMTTAGILSSVYGALEHFGHSFSCLLVDGSFGVDCWVQDVKNRVFASFGQPNWLAAYLITLLPLTTVLALKDKVATWRTYFYLGSSVLFFVVLLYTQSRSGFLGLAAGGVVLGALLLWRVFIEKKTIEFLKNYTSQIGILLGGMAFLAAITGTPVTPSLSQLFAQPVSSPSTAELSNTPAPVVNRLDVGGTDSGEIRKIVWEGAIKVWQRYPWFGSGLETFGYSYYLDRPAAHNLVSEWDFLYNKAHNEFLNYLATAGIVGLLSYLLLLGWPVFIALKNVTNRTTTHSTAFLLAGIVAGIVALSVSNFFGFSTVMVVILMHLYFAFISVSIVMKEPEYQDESPVSISTYLFLGMLGLLAMFMLRMVYQYWSADVAYSKGKSYLDAGYFEEGIQKMNEAIQKNSQEALFYDELSNQYANYAVVFAQQNQPQEAKALVSAALEASNKVTVLNSHQLNFYKTRARMFITLSQLNPQFLQQAKEALEAARQHAPTDPKILFNLGLVEISLEQTDAGLGHLQEAIALKPNYESARWQLALALEGVGKNEAALEQLNYIVTNLAPNNQAALDKIASLSAQRK